MAEEPDQIKREIEALRDALEVNLRHLENRFRTATNWHTWVDRKPLVALAIAFGGGLLLATRR